MDLDAQGQRGGVGEGHLPIATPAKFCGRVSGVFLLVTNLMGISMGLSG
jgi:hypothetical protein